MAKKKEEIWWCVKVDDRLMSHTVSLNQFSPKAIWLRDLCRGKFNENEKVVRIAVREVEEKDG